MELAIDTGAIQKRIMRNFSVPVGLPIGKEVNGFDAALGAPVKPDVDKAKALMKEAGYENGFSVTLDCTSDRFMNDEATCLAVAASLARINIKVDPRAQPTAKWATQVNPPEYNTSMAMLGYSPAAYDAHIFLTSIAATRDPQERPRRLQHRRLLQSGGRQADRPDRQGDRPGQAHRLYHPGLQAHEG
jgi:peptide/nickel transport system substrate-binding protein